MGVKKPHLIRAGLRETRTLNSFYILLHIVKCITSFTCFIESEKRTSKARSLLFRQSLGKVRKILSELLFLIVRLQRAFRPWCDF